MCHCPQFYKSFKILKYIFSLLQYKLENNIYCSFEACLQNQLNPTLFNCFIFEFLVAYFAILYMILMTDYFMFFDLSNSFE